VLGDAVRWAPGGKGANQAAACAKLGLLTAMVGAVGRDESGRALRNVLADHGVDVTQVEVAAMPTGLAVVLVDRDGESSIVVSPGANARPGTCRRRGCCGTDHGCPRLLCQLEVPVETVGGRRRWPAGWWSSTPHRVERSPTRCCKRWTCSSPTRHELATLTGRPDADSLEDVADAARSLAGPGRSSWTGHQAQWTDWGEHRAQGTALRDALFAHDHATEFGEDGRARPRRELRLTAAAARVGCLRS
jgi:ribokinase